ncbi:hypothetical protein MMC30_001820 [Trapelia coarctata]|nr:hypothetical protein [Trapelia coarctata]
MPTIPPFRPPRDPAVPAQTPNAQVPASQAPTPQVPAPQAPVAQHQVVQSLDTKGQGVQGVQGHTAEDGLHKLLGTGEYSDFTVTCGKRVWRVHRAIVCSRSTYFKKVCDGSFKEAKQGTITFEEDDPTLIDQMLLYLYTRQYPQPYQAADRAVFSLLYDARIYAVADKYELPDFKAKIQKAFEQLLADHFDHPLFATVAAYVYESTPQSDRGLRDPFLDVLWDHKTTLLPKSEVQEAIRNDEGFKNDVLESLFMDPGFVEQQTVNTGARSSAGTGSKKRRGGGRYFSRRGGR